MASGSMRVCCAFVVAAGLAGCSTGGASASHQQAAAPSGPVDGARLFQRRCAVCHGSTGEGQAMAFGARSSNLTEAAFQARVTDAALLQVMRNGIGRMPAVTGLRDDEAKAIAAHVRSIRRP